MTQNTTPTTTTGTTTDTGSLDTLARRAPATDDLLDLADWLAVNGAAHLSVIERIELAERLITRRRFLIGAGGLLGAAALGACGADEQAVAPTATPASAGTGATRTFVDGTGREIEIPANPQRIVALHDAGVLVALLELGVRPLGSASITNSEGEPIFRGTQDYDTEGIVPVGWAPVNLEAIAALQPDLLIVQGEPDSVPANLLEEIGPVIYLNRFNRPHLDALVQLADVVGRIDEALKRRAELEAKIEDIKHTVGDDVENTTVSIIAWVQDEGTFRPAFDRAMWATIFDEVPFTRPEPSEAWDPANGYFSVEVLPEHDGDVIILESFTEGNMATVEEFAADPLASTLPAVQAGQVYLIDGIVANGFSWEGANATVEFIGEILAHEELNRDLVEE